MGSQITCIIALSILICVHIVYGIDLYSHKAKDEGKHEIIDGKCSIALVSDMIFRDHVHKTRIPLMSREATSSWHGEKKIYCLKVLNDKEESKGATVFVKDGGVGHNFVTIEMHSAKNHGLEFTIQAFAR